MTYADLARLIPGLTNNLSGQLHPGIMLLTCADLVQKKSGQHFDVAELCGERLYQLDGNEYIFLLTNRRLSLEVGRK